MAFSWQESVKPAGTQDIQCDIEYLDKSYIHVYLDGTETTAFTWTSDTNIRLDSALSADSKVLLVRKTEREYLYIQFASGAPFIEGNVDTQNTQFLHLAQELVEGRAIEGFYGDISMNGYRITNVGAPVDVSDAATKGYVDSGDTALDTRISAEVSALDTKISAEVTARIRGDIKALDDAKDYTDSSLAGVILPQGMTDVGYWLPSAVSLMGASTELTPIGVRGFYRAQDGGAGVWVKTGNVDLSLAGKHFPASAVLYTAEGVEYRLKVESGDTVDARANGLRAIDEGTSVDDQTEDFTCVAEAVNGITGLVKTMVNDEDLKTYLKVVIPAVGTLRQGKSAIKAYSRLTLDFQQCSVYTRPSPLNRQEVTGVYMNAIERGIEDIQYISNLFSGATSYSNMTLSDFHIIGGRFYGDHKTTLGVAECSTGTGILTYNMENSTLNGCWFQDYAVGRQYVRTVPGYYYNNLGQKVLGTLVPEVATSGIGSYEGVHESDVTSYGLRYLHLRTVSNWGRFDKCKFGTYANWASSPDGSQFDYFIENWGAGVVFTSGVIEANNMNAGPLKGYVLDSARGVCVLGLYYENATAPGWVISKPANSFYYRGNGLHLDNLGSYYLTNSRGQPLVAFEEGFFGSYNANGEYERGGWETYYNYFAGPNTWAVGSPTPDLGAFPHGVYDFKFGTYGIHYSGSVPDVDSVRDTLWGNEFLSPYGLQVNSGTLLLPMANPAHQSNIVVWFKDLTGNFDVHNLSVGWNDNNNAEDGSSVNLYQTYGVRLFDYRNGYKAALIPYVNPRATDSRMYTSAGNKLRIVVDSSAPIILKAVQAFVGGVPIFPSKAPEYVPRTQADRVWGTMNSGDTSSGAYYGSRVGGGIFKPGDVVTAFSPFANADLRAPAKYQDISSTYGINTETRTITGGAAWGAGLSGATFNLTITAVDSGNSWTTVQVPTGNLPHVICGLPLNVTANSSGGSTGFINIIKRVSNGDGTLSNQYVLEGLLGSVGGTLTVSTSSAYTVATGVSRKLTGTTNSFSVSSWLSVVGGDSRVGYGATSAGTRQIRYYYNGTDVSAGMGSAGANTAYITGTGGITLNGSILSSITYSFGTSSAYPANIYSQNAVTVVSDATRKEGIRELNSAEIKLSSLLAKLFRAYKLKSAIAEKGDAARLHVGTVAQLVIEAFTEAGLDWHQYGVVTYERWDAADEVLDDDGVVVTPAREAGEIYMVRYDELNALILAGQEARIAALESALSKEE